VWWINGFVLTIYLYNREAEPDWVSDLESDIKIECERYGPVEQIKVNGDSMVKISIDYI
jgi:RNA-binding protein 39